MQNAGLKFSGEFCLSQSPETLSAIMKQLYILISTFVLVCCSDIKNDKIQNEKKTSTSINDTIEQFESYLNRHKIEPTFTSSLDSISYFNKNLKIKNFDNNHNFKIEVNNYQFEVKKLKTLNDVWNGKDSLHYTNQISQIKYYKDLNKILFLLDFDMCTGIGCSVNYQIIYDLKTKNILPFGRFRTGDDMNIYKIDNVNYYLSKTFHGRNAQLKDTIFYDLYNIDNLTSFSKAKRIAEFTYHNEDYEKPKTFKSININ